MKTRSPQVLGKRRWTEAELHVAATYASRVYQKNLTYYRSAKLCHAALPARSEAGCREVIRSFVSGRRKIDAADIWIPPITGDIWKVLL